MGKANSKCFGCGDIGHFESECPNKGIDGDGRPRWCGFCDERTRTIDKGNVIAKCSTCHPDRRKQLKQHRRCPDCHLVVYEWDNAPCGRHRGPDATDHRPEHQTIDHIVSTQ